MANYQEETIPQLAGEFAIRRNASNAASPGHDFTDPSVKRLGDIIPLLLAVTDAAGKVVYRNRRWRTTTTQSDETDRSWLQIVHAPGRRSAIDQWDHSLTSGEVFEQ